MALSDTDTTHICFDVLDSLLFLFSVQGDFHHWVDLFNHFDSFFEKYVKPRKDLQIDDDFLDLDPLFPRESYAFNICSLLCL